MGVAALALLRPTHWGMRAGQALGAQGPPPSPLFLCLQRSGHPCLPCPPVWKHRGKGLTSREERGTGLTALKLPQPFLRPQRRSLLTGEQLGQVSPTPQVCLWLILASHSASTPFSASFPNLVLNC